MLIGAAIICFGHRQKYTTPLGLCDWNGSDETGSTLDVISGSKISPTRAVMTLPTRHARHRRKILWEPMHCFGLLNGDQACSALPGFSIMRFLRIRHLHPSMEHVHGQCSSSPVWHHWAAKSVNLYSPRCLQIGEWPKYSKGTMGTMKFEWGINRRCNINRSQSTRKMGNLDESLIAIQMKSW